tara:strand:- start:428 stop:718 length:291 start_codon:yes stop_codon:yes gene_type:complete
MIRDIISFIKLIPEAWRTHRRWQKAERELLKLEAEHGPYKTFLMYFEEAVTDGVDEEFLILMLNQFEADYTIDENDEDCKVIMQYLNKYVGVAKHG